MKKVYVREEFCMNCRLCEVYCAVAHSPTSDIVKAYRTGKEKPVPRMIVESENPSSFAVQCRHCPDPPCVDACISGAMSKDPVTQIVHCDEERCLGCWSCIASCPFGAIQPGTKNGRKIALKCDLCFHQDMPACVLACPNEALVCEETDEQ